MEKRKKANPLKNNLFRFYSIITLVTCNIICVTLTHPVFAQRNTFNDTLISVDSITILIDQPNRKVKVDTSNTPFFLLDEYAKNTPKEVELSIPLLVKYLIIPAKNETEKARLLFTWVATHIDYDANGFNTGRLPNHSVQHVLQTKKAVCEGYSNVLHAMCEVAKLESLIIQGYAKGYAHKQGTKFVRENHSWNSIKLDNEWKLFDVTWAASYGVEKNSKLVSIKKFEPFWFAVPAKAFVFTHFPKNADQLFLKDSIGKQQFEKYPTVNETFYKLGFKIDDVYDTILKNPKLEIVETFSNDVTIQLEKAPYTKNLQLTDTLNIKIKSEIIADLVLLSDGKWHTFNKENNFFTIQFPVVGKTIEICMKKQTVDKFYSLLMRYTVK